jgi:hypothetical protein
MLIIVKNLIQENLLAILELVALVSLFLLCWNIFIQFQIHKIKKDKKILFSGSKVCSLEEVILSQAKTLRLLDKDIQELFNISNQINSLASKGLYKFGMIRFNPFKDIGGDQSFSVAFLNGKNNGLVISSLFTREGNRVYSKSITEGKSEKYPLTEEEKEAIEIAIKNK